MWSSATWLTWENLPYLKFPVITDNCQMYYTSPDYIISIIHVFWMISIYFSHPTSPDNISYQRAIQKYFPILINLLLYLWDWLTASQYIQYRILGNSVIQSISWDRQALSNDFIRSLICGLQKWSLDEYKKALCWHLLVFEIFAKSDNSTLFKDYLH